MSNFTSSRVWAMEDMFAGEELEIIVAALDEFQHCDRWDEFSQETAIRLAREFNCD